MMLYMRIQAPGEYVHAYNRGMQKQPIFETDSDRLRFLFLALTFQGEHVIKNVSRELKQNVQNRILHIDADLVKEVLKNRMVEVVNFCLMPNHFHFLLKELKDGGIAKYMQRLLIAYTKYFNKRHDKSGHLFQGSYKSVHVENDEQLMYLSAYIHKNPSEIRGWAGKEDRFPWSSYPDCLNQNRFGNLLMTDIVTERFIENKDMGTYQEYVETSSAKELNNFFKI